VHKNKRFIIIDTILTVFSLYIALLLKFDFDVPVEYILFFKLNIIPVIVITILFNAVFNLYKHLWKYASIEELLSIVYSVSLSNIVFIIYSYFINYRILENQYFRFPFTVHIIFWILCTVFLGGTRFIYRISGEFQRNAISDSNKIRLLIVGAGDAGAMLIKEIKKHSELNYDIVGLVDDDSAKVSRTINGVKVLGTSKDIPAIYKRNKVEEIILAIPSADNEVQKNILKICKETKCKLKTVPGIYEILDGKVNISKIREVNIEDLLGREPVKLDINNITRYITNKVVLVTGGGGSIGSELCRQIAKFTPKELIILDIYENNAYDLQMELKHLYPKLNLKVIIASVRDVTRISEIFDKHRPNVVFHAAAHKHVPLMEDNPREVVKNNVLGTYNVAKCSSNFNVEKFVLISTDKAVNPTNIMGASKRFCEIIVQALDKVSKTEYVAVRFGNVLGSNGSVIPLFKKQIAHGGPLTVTHPEITRFFMTIPEASQLVIQAAAIAKGGEIFVLDMGEPVKIADLARDLIKLSGLEPDVDIKIEYSGLRPGEKLYEELLMDEIALTSTEHKKIFVEKPMNYDMKYLESSIDEFKNVIDKNDEEIFKLMEEKVPTYKRKKNN
jgi:FlaA1/EpsC-like NDP-sugar epimerase